MSRLAERGWNSPRRRASNLPMWTCPSCRTAVVDGRFCPFDRTQLVLVVDGCTVERELGRGLSGEVHAARRADGTAVAIKILHRDWVGDDEMRERFVREARAAATVDHPCVVAPSSAGLLDDGRPYLIMDLVEGPSLEEVLALGPLAAPRALAIARDLAGALAAVHAAGVIHRDVKPSNVRIGRDGRACLLDFGVALRPDADDARLTGGGLTIGTPHYMAPEQCTGDAVDGRTDVYALGVVLYRMLTGRLPFEGPAVAVMLAHASRTPEPPSTHVPVPAALDALVMRCLAKRRDRRLEAGGLDFELTAVAWGLEVDPRARTEATELDEADEADEADELDQGIATVDAATTVELAGQPLARASVGRHPRQRASGTGARWQDAPPAETDAHMTRRPRRGRVAVAALLVAATAAALVAFTPLHHALGLERLAWAHPHAAAAAAPAPVRPPTTPPPAAVVTAGHQLIVASDDLVAIRVAVPATLEPGRSHELTVEVWDAAGLPVDTTDLVVTFAGPRGATIGLAADPTRTRGVYRVTARFAERGAWTMRVFAPLGDSVVQLRLDVGAAPDA